MRYFLLCLVLLSYSIVGQGVPCIPEYYCNDSYPPSCIDNISQTHAVYSSDEFLSGYLQALVDTHYYEFQVRVLVRDHKAYIFNLPYNELIEESILSFILDVPCIDCVEAIDCSPEEFLCSLQQSWNEPQEGACEYCSMEAVCEVPLPCCHVEGIWFPQSTVLFAPLIADPRQVTNSGSIRFNDDAIGKHVGACTFGGEFPFFRWKHAFYSTGDLQIGLEAGIFSVFDLDNPDACMVNTDYFVGPSLTYAICRWSYRLRVWHLSSHLGDEFLLENPEYKRCNRSEEAIDFFASYQKGTFLRLYGGVGYIFDSDKDFYVQPFYVEFGSEIRVFGCRSCFNKLYVQPFFAMNFLVWEEHDYDLDATYLLGVEYSSIQGIGRKFRIFFEYHDGYSVEGQFVRDRVNYLAIRVMYGF
ncbi:MAG: DUF1207 domain-containing protein [Chlamydiia bacterium]|nr:DUF1207 domain-containing protein [Chlamydiia bacterium]